MGVSTEPDQTAARDASTGHFQLVPILTLGGGCFALLAVGIWSTLNSFPFDGGFAWTAAALGGIALVTFVAFWTDSSDIRTAIAATFVMTYFACLFIFLLNTKAADLVEKGAAKDLFDGFQDMMKIVVVFYFGTKAVDGVSEAIGKRRAGT